MAVFLGGSDFGGMDFFFLVYKKYLYRLNCVVNIIAFDGVMDVRRKVGV